MVVTATNGEVGEIHNHDDPESIRDRLGEVRIEELRAAGRILGVSEIELLGYRDSGMMGTEDNLRPECFWQADFMEAVGRLVSGDPSASTRSGHLLRPLRGIRPSRSHPGAPHRHGRLLRGSRHRPVPAWTMTRSPGSPPSSTGPPGPVSGHVRPARPWRRWGGSLPRKPSRSPITGPERTTSPPGSTSASGSTEVGSRPGPRHPDRRGLLVPDAPRGGPPGGFRHARPSCRSSAGSMPPPDAADLFAGLR